MPCEKCGYTPKTATLSCPRCGAALVSAPPLPAMNSDAGGWSAAGAMPAAEPLDDRTIVRPNVASPQPVVAELAPDPYPAEQNLHYYAPSHSGADADPWPAFAPVDVPLPAQVPATLGTAVAPATQRWLDQAGGDPRYLPTATLGVRFGAHLLDVLVVSGVTVGVLVVGALVGWLVGTITSGATFMLLLVLYAASIVLPLLYFAWGWGNGQTIGKRAMGLAVIDVNTGGPIGPGRAFARVLMLSVMALPLYLGFLSLLSEDRRGWHDTAVNSRVVRLPAAYR